MSRSLRVIAIIAVLATAALLVALAPTLGGAATARLGSPTPAVTEPAAATGPTPTPSPTTSPTAVPASPAVPTPAPTPTPGPSLVPGPLDGLPTTVAAARRHPIAVMVDDLSPARPQSGFSAASIVWQAPAEGGIPRYMMIFNEKLPKSVGPIRSSRLYFIAWAAEWRAVYVHVGGSPQALETLRSQGRGQLVYDADGFVYEGRYLYRVTNRLAPHNEYSDAKNLARLTNAVGAKDGELTPAWQFGPPAALADRPKGGTIDVTFPANHIQYAYDRQTNTYRRSVSVEGAQHDAATGERVAPTNVIALVMHFGPLNDGHPDKKRLEAQFVGSGPAWISTNGVTIRGTWRKASIGAPTKLFDRRGRPVTLTAGQTFVQVVESASQLRFVPGKPVIVPPRPGAGVA